MTRIFSNTLRTAWGAALALGLAFGTAQAQGRTFAAEGSDAVQGVGARNLAMGGTGVATAADPYAIYYNPSLLADVDQAIVTITRQIDGTLRPFTFAGFALPVTGLEELGLDVTLGAARYNRIHARATGGFGANEPESIFLRFMLPGVNGTYKGRVDSKTLVNRFAVGVRFDDIPRLSLGFNADFIDCRTETCGTHAGSNGFESRSLHARAFSYGVSATYHLSDALTFGVAYTDIDAVLHVQREVTDNAGTRIDSFTTSFGRKLAAEGAFRLNDRWLFAFGGKREWGSYGRHTMDVITLHGGMEFNWTDVFTLRAGAWSPVKMQTGTGTSLTSPVIFAPTAGAGLTMGNFSADVSLYAHPLMTMHKKSPVLSGDLTLSYRF